VAARAAFAAAISDGRYALEPWLARRACFALNGEPKRVRAVFRAISIDRRNVAQCTAAGLGSEAEIVQLLDRALSTIERAIGASDATDLSSEGPS
jgi:hypothetical protein